MRVTRMQLDILRLIQQSPTITHREIAESLRLPGRQNAVYALCDFAKANGLPDYKWFTQRIKDYDLSALKPWRERRGAMGISWSTERQRWVAKYNRHFIGSFLFRDDAIEAREKYIASLV